MNKLSSILVYVTKAGGVRNDQLGDWVQPINGNRVVVVADLGDPDFTLLLAIHEILEQHLCAKHGVHEDVVNRWDAACPSDEEPGDDPRAPYYAEHQAATAVERAACEALGVSWEQYEAALERTYDGR